MYNNAAALNNANDGRHNNTITGNRPNPLRWLGSQLLCGGDLPVGILKMRDFLLKMTFNKAQMTLNNNPY